MFLYVEARLVNSQTIRTIPARQFPPTVSDRMWNKKCKVHINRSPLSPETRSRKGFGEGSPSDAAQRLEQGADARF